MTERRDTVNERLYQNSIPLDSLPALNRAGVSYPDLETLLNHIVIKPGIVKYYKGDLVEISAPIGVSEDTPLAKIWDGLSTIHLVAIPREDNPDAEVLTDADEIATLPLDVPVISYVGASSHFAFEEIPLVSEAVKKQTEFMDAFKETFLPLRSDEKKRSRKAERIVEIWEKLAEKMSKGDVEKFRRDIRVMLRPDRDFDHITTYSVNQKIGVLSKYLTSHHKQDGYKFTALLDKLKPDVNTPQKLKKNQHQVGTLTASAALLRLADIGSVIVLRDIFDPIETYQAVINLRKLAESIIRKRVIKDFGMV